MLIRERTGADIAACTDLLLRVREADGYPVHLPPTAVTGFFTAGTVLAAWVAERDGRVVGHAALHCTSDDPTIVAAQRATGLPADRLAMVARLFVAPDLRRAGIGRLLLRHATRHARSLGRRAVLDVGQPLHAAVAMYEAEGWRRVDELHLALGADTLDLWVYVSPPDPPPAPPRP